MFGGQLSGWRDFQRLQRYARGTRGRDYWRSEWEDFCESRRLHDGEYRPIVDGYYIDLEEEWEDYWHRLRKEFSARGIVYVHGQFREWREFVKREGRTIEEQGFPEYFEALKERLTRHGFTRIFQLDEDLARQDRLTTWIEYLGYEYWFQDQYTISKRQQQRYDDAWKKLVGSKVLRPGECEENLFGFDTTLQHANEEERAKKALDSAESAVWSAEKAISKSHKSRLSLEQLQH